METLFIQCHYYTGGKEQLSYFLKYNLLVLGKHYTMDTAPSTQPWMQWCFFLHAQIYNVGDTSISVKFTPKSGLDLCSFSGLWTQAQGPFSSEIVGNETKDAKIGFNQWSSHYKPEEICTRFLKGFKF